MVSCVLLGMDLHGLIRILQACIILMMGCTIVISQTQITDVKLTSTEYSVTLTFTPNLAATNYTASFRLSQGIFWKDYSMEAPYNGSSVTVTHDNLLPGSRYTVEVFENKTKTSHRVFQQEIATVPLKPESLAVSVTGSSFLVLQWVSTHGFTYEAHEINFMRQNSTWQVENASGKRTFNLTGLNPGFTYQMYVVAVTAGVRSQRSMTITASTLPDPPVNLTARALGTSQVHVAWIPQPSSNQESFQVIYSLEGSNILTNASCDQSPCTITPGPPAGQVINIAVVSLSNGYRSVPAIIKGSTAPGLVSDLVGVPGVRSLNLSWSASVNSIQTSYKLTIATIGHNSSHDHTISATSPKMTYSISSLIGGYVYKVEVRAMTLYAAGDARADLFITIPESVLNLTGQTLNTTSVKLTWLNPQNSIINFLNITIIQPDGSFMFMIEEDSKVQTRTVSDLVPGEKYNVTVSVHSQYSSSEVTAVSIRTKPVQPRVAEVSASERGLNVTLFLAENRGVFDFFQATLEGLVDARINAPGNVAFSNLAPGTQYRLVAVTVSGAEASEYIYMDVFTKPRPPTNLTVDTSGGHVIRAVWNSPDSGGFDNFTVVLNEVNSITRAQTKVTLNRTVEWTDLQPGTTYNMSVASNKGDQTSATIWKLNTTLPLPVTNTRVTHRGTDTVVINWDTPIGSGLAGYAMTFEILNMTLLLLPANVTHYTLTGLKPNSNYTLKLFVYSQHDAGFQHYSRETIFNFFTYPESVAGLQKVVATTDMIMVNWTAPVSFKADYFNLGIRSVEPATPPQELSLNVPASRTNATFNGLKPGYKYMIAIRTVRSVSPTQAPQFGSSVRLAVVTKPLAVEEFQVTTINTTALRVRWAVNSTSMQNMFLVTYTADNVSKTTSVQASNSSSYTVSLMELYEGYEYVVRVAAVRSGETDIEESTGVNRSGFTAPLPVSNLTLTANSSDLSVSWTPPAGGNWSSYQIQYRPSLRVPDARFLMQAASQSMTNITITNLFPGEGYQVKVTVISHELNSSETEALAVLRPLPPKDLHVVKNKTTTTSLTLGWTYDQSATYTSKWSFHINGGISVKEVMATNVTNYSLELGSLVPGQTYNIIVTSVVSSTSSQQYHLDVTTKPVMSSKLEPVSSTNSSIAISYSNSATGIYDHLSFVVLEVPAVAPVNRSAQELPLIVGFTGLQAGTKYTVQGVAVSRGEISNPVQLETITDPNSVPVNLVVSATSVKLILGLQQGEAAQYMLTCTAPTINTTLCGQQTVTAGQQEVAFSELTPFQVYKFVVVTKSDLVRGEVKQVIKEYEVKTEEAAPTSVRSLSVKDEGLHSASLTWQVPEMINGILRSYTVSYHGYEPSDPQIQDLQTLNDINVTTTALKLDNLSAGFEYTFQVSAVTVAPSTAAETKITMKTAAPLFKTGVTPMSSRPRLPDQSARIVTDSKLAVLLTNPFTHDNGYVRYHTVVVSTDRTANNSAATLPSWADARKDSNIKVYQAMGQCQNLFKTDSTCGSDRARPAGIQESVVFVLGAETVAECEGHQFCNGPLLQNTEYYIKLRGYTASGLYQETEYSEKIKTGEATTNVTGIIGGVVGAVVAVIIMIVVVVIVMYCKRRPVRATKYTSAKNVTEHSLMTRISRPVRISDFPCHVLKMSADSDFKYAEEYEELKEVGRNQPCLAAELPPNRPKNRFTNILPYDHSRVKLLPVDDEEGSDYINANYMPGYNSKREYVATQGPLPATRDDFWRMVWEQNSHNIIMLTRCQEKGRDKSDRYWPSDTEPKFYGNLQIAVLSVTHLPDWTVTELRVSQGEYTRHVRQFHYRVWPDFGVPRNPLSLLQFVRTVREKLVRELGPIIVHCSAGVGRSGTFIVLDHVLQLIREKDEVDIFGIVYKLRQERVLMVQTEQQYKFIHECLLCVLEGKEDDMTYVNLGRLNVTFEDDEGINVEMT